MVLRERSAGMYYIAGYFLAKLCAELPFQLIFPCIFVRAPSPPPLSPSAILYFAAICARPLKCPSRLLPTSGPSLPPQCCIQYFMVGFSLDVVKFFIYCATVVVTNVLAASIGVCIGAAISNVEVANATTPVIIMPLLLAGGLFANNSKLDPYWLWLKALSPVQYAFNIVMENEVGSLPSHARKRAPWARTGPVAGQLHIILPPTPLPPLPPSSATHALLRRSSRASRSPAALCLRASARSRRGRTC